jgi:hypothetical protein
MVSRSVKLTIVPKPDRRSRRRTRIEPLSARISDLYRERIPAYILNVSATGLGLTADEPFKINLPVLVECFDLLIVANVRHCIRNPKGLYLLGLEIHKTVDIHGIEQMGGLEWRLACRQRVRTAG